MSLPTTMSQNSVNSYDKLFTFTPNVNSVQKHQIKFFNRRIRPSKEADSFDLGKTRLSEKLGEKILKWWKIIQTK